MAKRRFPHEIIIKVKGGAIQEVDIPKNNPEVSVRVLDYDTDGEDDSKLSKDEDGSYREMTYLPDPPPFSYTE